jgi:hypothetical protein
LEFELFPQEDQALWCFELRDKHEPRVALGDQLELNVLELPKAERLWQGSGQHPLLRAAKAWTTFFHHWQEGDVMAQVEHEPVAQAMDRLRELSADKEARRMAFVRERARRDEVSALRYTRQEGLAEGIEKGESTILRRQLTRRFGPLPEWPEQRLQSASSEQLEAWADAVLDARSLEEVFRPRI